MTKKELHNNYEKNRILRMKLENPDKYREFLIRRAKISKKYSLKNKQKKSEYQKKFYLLSDNKKHKKIHDKEYRAKNREKRTQKMRDYRKQNKDWWLNWNFKYQYGVSLEDIKQMLIKQEGKCAICGLEISLSKGKGIDSACVDHDHQTKRVRGLLCRKCNFGIG